MASSRSRQRKLARAKYDRQMARRAAAARRKRRVQAGIGASLAVTLVVVGAIWLFGGFEGDEKPMATPDLCVWNKLDAATNDKLTDVGTPPTDGLPTSGTAELMMSTNQGVVYADLDVAKAPCATASLRFLADQGFYGNTECHQLLTGENGIYALRCGDPSGTGNGGPTYTFASENLPQPVASSEPPASPDPSVSPTTSQSPSAPASQSPSAPADRPMYRKGTVALANDVPGGNGSQFFIFYQDSRPDSAQYPIVGTVTRGLDVIEKIAKAGKVGGDSDTSNKPLLGVKIQNFTVTGPGATDAPPPVAPTTGTTPAPSTAPTTGTTQGTSAPANGSPSATS